MKRILSTTTTILLYVLAVVHGQKPEQIHIAFNGDHGMAISWATKNGNTKTSIEFIGTCKSSLRYTLTPLTISSIRLSCSPSTTRRNSKFDVGYGKPNVHVPSPLFIADGPAVVFQP